MKAEGQAKAETSAKAEADKGSQDKRGEETKGAAAMADGPTASGGTEAKAVEESDGESGKAKSETKPDRASTTRLQLSKSLVRPRRILFPNTSFRCTTIYSS